MPLWNFFVVGLNLLGWGCVIKVLGDAEPDYQNIHHKKLQL